MTAPLAEPVGSAGVHETLGTRPGRGGHSRLSEPAVSWGELVAVIPVGFFLLLAVLFEVAVIRRDEATERAAAWGVSASFSFGFAVLAAVAAFAARSPGGRLLFGRYWTGGLVVASLVVTAIAVDLVLIDEPVGAWMLMPPAIVTSLTGFLVLVIRTIGKPPEPAEPLVRAEEAEEPQEPRTSVDEPPTGPVQLLHPNAVARLAESGLAVALDEDFWRATEQALDPEALEQGGVALTVRLDGVVLVFGAVFPGQTGATSIRCEFPVAEVDRVRQAVNSVAEEFGCVITITWVHTHPGLSVFLSGTDLATSSNWRSLDPDFTPIVIDISKPGLAEQIGVFDTRGRIEAMALMADLIEPRAVERLESALRAAYRRDGLADPLVLLPALARLERA